MTPEPPGFRTKTLSPVSPLPLHPPEPSNNPDPRNQINPIFNMTATHLEEPTPPVPILPSPMQTAVAPPDDPKSPSVDSSFSDEYKEQSEGTEEKPADNVDQETDVSDDYAMAVDSDGDEQADSQGISQAKFESDTKSLPATVSDHTLPSSILSHDPPATDLAQPGQGTQPTPTNSSPTHPTVDDTANIDHFDAVAAQTSIEETKLESHTYDDATNGGIDIQQLLDNITANAEKNESNSPATTPSTQSSKITLAKGSSGLPTHASLPPRPNIPQKRPYPDDIQKYHAGAPGVPQPSVSYRLPGGVTALIAAGAPGTSTDPRGGLPPPPSASFRPAHMSTGSPVSPASYTQINRSAGLDRQATSIESQDEADEADAKWGPDVQKIYDEFLADERMYVQEGLWDRFPLNSRLFIGKLINGYSQDRNLTCSNRQSPKREGNKTRPISCISQIRQDCTGINQASIRIHSIPYQCCLLRSFGT
jgi:nuclear polyadenylated RNA-binding protein 3